ncbi:MULTISPECIES: hypothetical protein [Streptomyces]|uniref:Uncharacterized protein n=4 Tax=Streptomyces TaxID=1883 RepID=A0A6A0CEM3_9ACTN|nr:MULTISPECIES: hypothetical protein [Streptomyces]NEE33350.1 hypothetical protein [Streptomyces sp. SID7982]NEE45683.1 hypothetical protein [Streptomyces sp. SID8455]MBL3805088.1 hypothetical protein [Streptomyces sp. BRB081]MDQ0293921.1 putative spore protein YtfJ [Streptomyces sp. DSM 41037]PJM81970.1 hypothetical protein CH313_18580 [Streptomyces sp. TSRI0384-2]
MRRHLRFTAVLIVVVLALTGFSTGSSSGKSGSRSKSRSSSGSGGGCSSSKKDNDTSRGSGHRGGYRDTHHDDTSSTGGSSSSTTTDQVTVTVVDCAGPGRTKRAKPDTTAALRVTSNSTTSDLRVTLALHFENAVGTTLDSPTTDLRLSPGETRTVTVRMTSPRKAAQVRDCEVDRVRAVTV